MTASSSFTYFWSNLSSSDPPRKVSRRPPRPCLVNPKGWLHPIHAVPEMSPRQIRGYISHTLIAQQTTFLEAVYMPLKTAHYRPHGVVYVIMGLRHRWCLQRISGIVVFGGRPLWERLWYCFARERYVGRLGVSISMQLICMGVNETGIRNWRTSSLTICL